MDNANVTNVEEEHTIPGHVCQLPVNRKLLICAFPEHDPDLVLRSKNGKPYSVRHDSVNAMFAERIVERAPQGAGIGVTAGITEKTDRVTGGGLAKNHRAN